MTAGFINGIVTAVLFVLFIGLVLWAWSGKRKHDFDRASRLPLDDHTRPPQRDAIDNNGKSS